MMEESMETKMKKASSETWACAVEDEECCVGEGVEEPGVEEHLPFVDTLFQSEAASEEPRVTFYILELMGRQSNNNKLCAIVRGQALNSTLFIKSHSSFSCTVRATLNKYCINFPGIQCQLFIATINLNQNVTRKW